MPAARENLDTFMVVTVGMLLVILVFVLILLLQAWFYSAQTEEYTRKVIEPRNEQLASAIADQQTRLHSYRWIDQENGVVGIPVERAMEKVVREGL